MTVFEKYGYTAPAESVPQQRIADKLDEYLSRRDDAGAERHLLYWLEEARQGGDRRGELFVCNELIGHYRKNNRRDEAFRFSERALALLNELGLRSGVTAGTTLVNAATACSAFEEYERALALFRAARTAYESGPEPAPNLLGGLYNNMALACKELGRYEEAYELYEMAMNKMAEVPGGALEQAITCLNVADTVAAELGSEAGEQRIAELLDRAYALLQDESAPRDGYYAFVCEKCAPGFSYYGYFAAAEELRQTAERIYERN